MVFFWCPHNLWLKRNHSSQIECGAQCPNVMQCNWSGTTFGHWASHQHSIWLRCDGFFWVKDYADIRKIPCLKFLRSLLYIKPEPKKVFPTMIWSVDGNREPPKVSSQPAPFRAAGSNKTAQIWKAPDFHPLIRSLSEIHFWDQVWCKISCH